MEIAKEDGFEAEQACLVLIQGVPEHFTTRGGILAALRRSSLVGEDIDMTRAHSDDGRITCLGGKNF